MIDVKNSRARKRGRPPAFDRGEVLGRAAQTFWRFGYEGASIADLTAAMGITPQSLYAAFGSKAALYAEALDWYQRHVGELTARILREETDTACALVAVLEASARAFAGPDGPRGCMISTALLQCAGENEPVARAVARIRSDTIALFRARIEAGIAAGQLRGDTDAGGLARFVGAMIQGLSIQARDGASAADLAATVAVAAAAIERYRAPSAAD